jgi:general stress protein 26
MQVTAPQQMMEEHELQERTMTQNDFTRVLELLDQFSYAMLVTQRGTELRSRPMAVAGATDHGHVRFLTRDDSAKLHELDEHSEVNLAMQGEGTFLSISGRARFTKDQDLKKRLLAQGGKLWFASGADDPHLIVLEVVPTYAEYWHQGAEGLIETVVDEAMSALGSDETAAAGDDKEHGTVDFKKMSP